jgi:hypothetical protein
LKVLVFNPSRVLWGWSSGLADDPGRTSGSAPLFAVRKKQDQTPIAVISESRAEFLSINPYPFFKNGNKKSLLAQWPHFRLLIGYEGLMFGGERK